MNTNELNNSIYKINEYINNCFNINELNQTENLNKIKNAIMYSSTSVYSYLNSLIYQEEYKKTTYKSKLNLLVAKKYEKIKNELSQYNINAPNANNSLLNDLEIQQLKFQYKNECIFIQFLKKTLSKISYYPIVSKYVLQKEEKRAKYIIMQ